MENIKEFFNLLISLFNDIKKTGRLKFTNSIISDLKYDTKDVLSKRYKIEQENKNKIEPPKKDNRGLLVLLYDTFVQPGVDQLYNFTTALSKDAVYILLWSSFEYAKNKFFREDNFKCQSQNWFNSL